MALLPWRKLAFSGSVTSIVRTVRANIALQIETSPSVRGQMPRPVVAIPNMMLDADETRDLVEKLADGDRTALERLLLDHYAPLAAHVSRRLPPSIQSVVGVDDVVQQTYTEVFRSIEDFEHREDVTFLSWLIAIADNRLRDAIRALHRKKRGGDHRRLRGIPDDKAGSAADLVDVLAGRSHTASRSLARREAIQAIQVALAGLPEEYRRAIELRYFDGYTLEQNAALMDRSTGAVRGLLDRAKKRIRDALVRASLYLSKK